jgi:hypothetical protein
MEAEAYALVVAAEGKAPEVRFFWAGVVGVATEFADGDHGGVDVGDREEDVDARLRIVVVEAAADRGVSTHAWSPPIGWKVQVNNWP